MIEAGNSTTYRCHECDVENLIARGGWCLCGVDEIRTLVCQACGVCFCKASAVWKSIFWANASRELKEQSRGAATGELMTNFDPTHVSSKPKVLIVDDDRVVHLVAERILVAMGLQVLHAFDGVQALAIAEEVRPEIVLTDALMPKMDGRELALKLKRSPITSSCKVVLMTALYKGLRYRNEAFRDFLVDEYLHKPVSGPQLREVVEALLAPRAGAQPLERSLAAEVSIELEASA